MEILRRTPWSRIRGQKQRAQRILGFCWQWEANGQCVKGDNCSFRHDMNKRGKMTQSNTSPNSFMQQNERKTSRTRSPRGKCPVVECLDGLARITSKELATTHFVKVALSRVLVLQDQEWLSVWEKCSYAHRQVDKQLVKSPKRMMTKVQ